MLTGQEVVRVLDGAGIVTRAPIELIHWSFEEDSRFEPTLLGSGVFELSEAERFSDAGGVTVADALGCIGYRREGVPSAQAYDAYFKLHIEQGPILERGRVQIGAVTGAQAQI